MPTLAEVVRACESLRDEVSWLRERFTILQNRVTSELREVRREVDRFYADDEEEE